jgi:hypothetical protein
MRHHAPPPLQHARSPTSISGQIKMLKKMSVNPKYYRWTGGVSVTIPKTRRRCVRISLLVTAYSCAISGFLGHPASMLASWKVATNR